MVRGFSRASLTGGLLVWFFRDDIQAYLDEQARLARVGAADRLHAVEETAERVFDRAAVGRSAEGRGDARPRQGAGERHPALRRADHPALVKLGVRPAV